MTIILYLLIAFVAGIVVGWRLTWWWMNRQWQRNPYAFKTIVEGVIELRKREGRL